MITFISPAKGFNETSPSPKQIPSQIEKSKIIIDSLRNMCLEELSKLMKIKEDLASLNIERFKDFKFDQNAYQLSLHIAESNIKILTQLVLARMT